MALNLNSMAKLLLKDYSVLSDIRNYISRIHQIEPSSTVRLVALNHVLLIYTAPFYQQGSRLSTIMGLRIFLLREQEILDVVVPVAELLDRIMRRNNSEYELKIPPQHQSEPWATITPPQSSWQLIDVLPVQECQQLATQGIDTIAQSLPTDAGAPLVKAAREKVWGDEISLDYLSFPQGAAFLLVSLGFVEEKSDIKVYSAGKWIRFSTAYGHVLYYAGSVELPVS
ncbi:MAG: hypothetical protein QM632_05385 [Micrococcaceae bacterium]